MLLPDLGWFSGGTPDVPTRLLARLMQIGAAGYAELCGDVQSKGGDCRGSGAKSPEGVVVIWIG